MKNIAIWGILLVIAVTSTAGGIAMLTIRHHSEAPQQYWNESINYQPRPEKSKIKVVVAWADRREMIYRIQTFIKANGGRHQNTAA